MLSSSQMQLSVMMMLSVIIHVFLEVYLFLVKLQLEDLAILEQMLL